MGFAGVRPGALGPGGAVLAHGLRRMPCGSRRSALDSRREGSRARSAAGWKAGRLPSARPVVHLVKLNNATLNRARNLRFNTVVDVAAADVDTRCLERYRAAFEERCAS